MSDRAGAAVQPRQPEQPNRPGRRRLWRAVRVGAFLVVIVTGLASIMLATLRATVLDRGFYTSAFDDARAFHRLYDEVLPDPQLSAVAGI
jgi:hypothetical protein